MADDWFAGRGARQDRDESFPASQIAPVGPALLSDGAPTTAALVAAYLLRDVTLAGGSRVKPAAVHAAVKRLEHALTADARRLCEDEAGRIARWCVDNAPADEEDLSGDLAMMASADERARVAVIDWAIDEDLDLEVEWYAPDEDRWPRVRATPLRIESFGDAPELVLKTSLAEISIPIANVRWVMPVERREQPRPPLARVLEFPPVLEEE